MTISINYLMFEQGGHWSHLQMLDGFPNLCHFLGHFLCFIQKAT